MFVGVNSFVRRIIELQKQLKIPANLKEQGADLNVVKENRDEILAAAMQDICTTTNPRETSIEDLTKILDRLMGAK